MNWLREFCKGRYVRSLEEELARVRQENRALLNSLLGVAGHAPVDFPAVPVREGLQPIRKGRSYFQQQNDANRKDDRRIANELAAMHRTTVETKQA